MRVAAIALVMIVPLPALAGYVVHPTSDEPDPPGIVAEAAPYFLDRMGQAWLVHTNGGSWERWTDFDPPVPLADVVFWSPTFLTTQVGEVFLWSTGSGWQSIGSPPSISGFTDVAPSRTDLLAVPNPSSASSLISFTLTDAGSVSVQIFDPTGRLIRTVLEGDLPAGDGTVEWNGRDDQGQAVAAGIYFSRVQTGSGEMNGRIVRR